MHDPHLTIPTVIDHTRDDLRRADTTAGLYILAIGALAALIGQIGDKLPGHVLVAVAVLAAPPAAATIGCAAAVLWPRHLNHRGIVAPGSWLHATHEPSWKTLLDAYRDADPDEYTARQLWILARIVRPRYRWLRMATAGILTTVGTLLLVLAYALLTALI
jgi:MFS family permease